MTQLIGRSSGPSLLYFFIAFFLLFQGNALHGAPPCPGFSVSVLSQSPPPCFGVNGGFVSFSGSGGTAPYQYSMDGVNFQLGSSFFGLAGGNYSAYILDASGCSDSLNFTLSQPPALVASLLLQGNPDCNGASNGFVTLGASGGSGTGYQFSDDGLVYQTASSFTGLTAGSYTFWVRDGNGCKDTLPITLVEPAPLILDTLALQGPSCNGGSTAWVQLTATGGTAPYLFSSDGINFVPNDSLPGLSAGNYSLTVQDAKGCQSQLAITLNDPPALSLSAATQHHLICYGDSAASVSLTGSGGSGSLEYSSDGLLFQSGNMFFTLPAGIHSFWVRDSLGCLLSITHSISQPPILSLQLLSQLEVDCNGNNTGGFQLGAQGGIGPYLYSLNGAAFDTISSFDSLAAGVHLLLVADSLGCIDSLSLNLADPPLLDLALDSVQQVQCFGTASGMVIAQGLGGTLPYEYSLDGINFSAGNNFNNLTSGSYTLIVRDNYDCLDSVLLTLIEPPKLNLSLSISSPVICEGDSNGALSVSSSGGTGGHSYSWVPGGMSGSQISGIGAGNYMAQVSDSLGCTAFATTILSEPAALIPQLLLTDSISCYGADDGKATALTSGGIGPYSYAWSQGIASGPGVSQVPAGPLVLTVTDSLGCARMDTLTLTEPALLSASLSGVHVRCYDGTDGSISVTASGGTAPYSYLWSSNPPATQPTLAGLAAGLYQVTITDIRGCRDSSVFVVTQPEPLVLSKDSANETCSLANGYALALASGGTAPYTYSWSTGQAGPVIQGLSQGSYTVVVTDSQSCQGTTAFVLTDSAPPVLSLQQVTEPSCYGLADGSATVSVSGNASPSIQWLTSPAQSGTQLTQVPAGSYLVVADDGLCRDSLTVQISQPDSISLSLVVEQVSCYGANDGSLTALVSGGTAPYQYFWNPGSGGAAISGLGPGSYSLRVQDARLCEKSMATTITETNMLEVTVITSEPSCYGYADGELQIAAFGGTPGYAFSWTTGDTGTLLSGITAGNYRVHTVDSMGCELVENIALSQPSKLILDKAEVVDSYCLSANGSASVRASGGTPGYRYLWNSDPPQTDSLMTQVAGDTLGRSYHVRVTDIQGCSDSLSLLLFDSGKPNAYFSTSPDPTFPIPISVGQITFVNRSTRASSYAWDFGDRSAGSSQDQPRHRFPEPGPYTVTLIAYDVGRACPDTFSRVLELTGYALFVPTAFTPNGDFINDYYYIGGDGVSEWELDIYDRWGQWITKVHHDSEGWNGTLTNGQPAPEGVYTCRIRAVMNSSDVIERSTSVTLLR